MRSQWQSIRWIIKAAQVRLRFLAALAVAFVVVAGWDVIRGYYDRWMAPKARDALMGAVSADTEYFCPMDPGVLSGWPGKCPICVMALVRRAKGDMGPLPDGVIARVQLSPDRVLLGGIRSAPVRYRPLMKEIRSVGPVSVEAGTTIIRAEIGKADATWIETGQSVEVAPDPSDGTSAVIGLIRAIESPAGDSNRLVVEVPEPSSSVAVARFVLVLVRSPVAGREPFRSMPRGQPIIRVGDPRSIHVCPDHPEFVLLESGHCPKDAKPLERIALAANQRVGWWCPMHPRVVADRAGSKCEVCGGMVLLPRVVSYAPAGEVLTVPESSVIDTGTKKVVYVERMPGMFDGVEVLLGPRSGSFYPVVAGLETDQMVAEAGAFLIDAETRLNPSLAASYFGARRTGVEATQNEPKVVNPDVAGLSPADRELALAQGSCPVTGKPLGSMGVPPRVVVQGRQVFLCCKGCESAIEASPEKYLPRLKPSSAVHHP